MENYDTYLIFLCFLSLKGNSYYISEELSPKLESQDESDLADNRHNGTWSAGAQFEDDKKKLLFFYNNSAK